MTLIETLDGKVVWRANLESEGDRQRLLDRLNEIFQGTFEFAPELALDCEAK